MPLPARVALAHATPSVLLPREHGSVSPKRVHAVRRLAAPLVAAFALGACASAPERDVVLLHAAFGTPENVVLEGRLVEADGDEEAAIEAADDSVRLNLRRNVALFTTDACDECPVRLALAGAEPAEVETDEAGFFRAELESATPLVADGWQPFVAASGTDEREGEALIVPPGNRLGIVSDIDDTVLVTEVGDTFRMIGNTFLKNPLQREAVPGVAALYARTLATNVRPDAAPLFFLSSSPRELQAYLTGFLERNAFPRGVLFTRRLTLDRTGYARLDAVAYKTARIEELLERLPDVTFVLVGDDGEHDPDVYDDVRRRHPGRIAAVWIRRANPLGPETLPEGQVELADVLDGTVAVPTAPLPVPATQARKRTPPRARGEGVATVFTRPHG